MIDLFSVIDDAVAIVRLPKGVYKQTKIYRRGARLYVPHGGGYVRIGARFGDTWCTSHPDVKVAEMEGVDNG